MSVKFLLRLTCLCYLILNNLQYNTVLAQGGISSFPQEATRIANLNIKAFCQDSLGYMWIATPRGLNRYNGYEFLQYFHDPLDSNSISNYYVRALFLDSSKRLWVGTTTGIDRFNYETNCFEHFPKVKNRPPCDTRSFFEDHQKNIWAVTTPGAVIVDTVNGQLLPQKSLEQKYINLFWEDNSHRLWMGLNEKKGLAVQRDKENWDYLSLPGERGVMCMYQDQQGIWWLGTNEGLVIFDPVLQEFKDLPVVIKNNPLLNHTQINFIKEIGPLLLLIGTDSQGIFQYDIPSQRLMHNGQNQQPAFNSTQMLSCYIDRDQNVWLGSFDKGFKVWNSCLAYFNSDQHLSDLFKDKFVTQIAEDRHRNLWVSTRYDGLFCYNTTTGKLTAYNTRNSNLFPSDESLIESVYVDSHNRIWICQTDHIIVAKVSAEGHLQKLFVKNDLKWVSFMKEDSSGNLWLCSYQGLYRIKMDDPSLIPELIYSGKVTNVCLLTSGDILFSSFCDGIYLLDSVKIESKQLFTSSEDSKRINQQCISLCEDSHHRIWIGSYGAGLLCVSPDYKQFRIFDKKNGLPSNDILRIEEGKYGDMWISTSYGLSKLRMADTTFINYYSSDGTLGNQYHEKAGIKLSDGRIFFAGNHGLTFFHPMIDIPSKLPPTVCLTDFKILNQSVKPSEGSVLTKSLPFVRQITLNHRQTVISIDYTGIDFLFPNKLTYAYMLEGFDKDWNYVGNHRRATYSNLTPGEYIFKVKVSNGEGIEGTAPATLKIRVKPAPWFSWPALITYFWVVVLVIYMLFRLLLKMRLNRHQLEIEQRERERERQISEMKMNFFTNISHELRTPLTLISAPLEQLTASQKLDEQATHLLNTISGNTRSMLRLINQLLDFNKMECGMLDLHVQQVDAIQFIWNIRENFLDTAKGKEVALDFTPHISSLPVWLDTDKVEKILYNLLSNALKFTPVKGKVRILTRELNQEEANKKYQLNKFFYLEIIVTDTGSGIPEDKLHELFVRYRQIVGPSGSKPDYGGSGIGLHYTKRLVETHHGKIMARIRMGKGMAFSFVLPIGDVYPDSEKIKVTDSPVDDLRIPENEAREDKAVDLKKNRYKILLAEDNVELMIFIRNLLNSQFDLIEALDGTTAWSMIESQSPDLILSDVLMPGLSGYELCRKVKQHPEFSHIPVILLTAKSTMNDQLEGLEQGADAYICKPFNVDYLLLTIKNMFKSRDCLRLYYSSPQNPKQKVLPVTLNIHDQKFMDNLTRILEQELANPDLNIDTIARDLGFSRTVFYRKIKGLSDMSPSEFLRSYRLRRAAEMIQEKSLSLSDIAICTGFNFYPHFSKSFKHQFGVSPKDYVHLEMD